MRKAILYKPLDSNNDYNYPVVNLKPEFTEEYGFTISYDDFYEDVEIPLRTDFTTWEKEPDIISRGSWNGHRLPCPNCDKLMTKTAYHWSLYLIDQSIQNKTMVIPICRACKNMFKIFPLSPTEYKELILNNEKNIFRAFEDCLAPSMQKYKKRFFIKDFCII